MNLLLFVIRVKYLIFHYNIELLKSKITIASLVSVIVVASLIVSISPSVSASDDGKPNVFFKHVDTLELRNHPGQFNYIFSVCVENEEMVDPRILVASDLQVRHVTLIEDFFGTECVTSSTHIRANDPASITPFLVSAGDPEFLNELKLRIQTLEQQAEREHQQLQTIMSTYTERNQDYVDRMNDATDQLGNTRRMLQEATEQFYQIQRHLHPGF